VAVTAFVPRLRERRRWWTKAKCKNGGVMAQELEENLPHGSGWV
jgi:hypothetical protein